MSWYALAFFFANSVLLGAAQAQGIPFPRELIDGGPASSPVELQALQTREFDADKPTLISAIVTVFQDEGYRITQTDVDVGTLVAIMPEEVRRVIVVAHDRDANRLVARYADSTTSMFSGAPGTLVAERTISVLVTELSPSKSKARLSAVVKARLSMSPLFSYMNPQNHEGTDTNSDRYQRLFARIQQALFVKSNTE
jgi:hypothetical protein